MDPTRFGTGMERTRFGLGFLSDFFRVTVRVPLGFYGLGFRILGFRVLGF